MQMLGMHGTVFANFAVDQSDLLLAFGVRFDDRVTGKLETFAANARIVHIDIDPAELNKNKESFITVTGDRLCFCCLVCMYGKRPLCYESLSSDMTFGLQVESLID